MPKDESALNKFYLTIISVVITLFVQFGGVVWYASELNTKVVDLGTKVDRLEVGLKVETDRTTPIIFEYKHINEVLAELKLDIKEIKKEVKGEKK